MSFVIHNFDSLCQFLAANPISVFALDTKVSNKTELVSIWPNFTVIGTLKTLDITLLHKKSNNIIEVPDLVSKEALAQIYKNFHHTWEQPVIQDLVNKASFPLILTQYNSPFLEKVCTEHHWKLAMSPQKTQVFWENKINFRKLLAEENIPTPKYEVVTKRQLENRTFSPLFPLIMQYPRAKRGKRTFMIKTAAHWQDFLSHYFALPIPPLKVLASEIAPGTPVSITGIATRWGVFTSQLQIQIIDTTHNETYGSFLGHDWSASKHIPASTQAQAIFYAKRIGTKLMEHGHRGMFGIDLIWNPATNNLVALECNPRLTGVLPALDLIQIKNKHMPFLALHLLEYMADKDSKKFTIDYERIQSEMIQPKEGAHIFIKSPHSYPSHLNAAPKPGIYSYKSNQLQFQKSSLLTDSISDSNQFLLHQVTVPGYTFEPHDKLCQIISLHSALNEKFELSDVAKQLMHDIPKTFQLTRA